MRTTERFRYFVQEPVPLHDSLRYTIRWYVQSATTQHGAMPPSAKAQQLITTPCRPLLDKPHQLPLEHHSQDHLHRRTSLHRLPDAQRLQAHPRPEPRHLQSRISARRRCCPRDPVPVQVHAIGNALGLQHLARERCDPAPAVYAAAHR
jgi:hypothetical protein